MDRLREDTELKIPRDTAGFSLNANQKNPDKLARTTAYIVMAFACTTAAQATLIRTRTLAPLPEFPMFEKLPHSLQRLRLRTLRSDDLDAFHAYRSDPVVARYQGWEPMALSQSIDFLQSQISKTSHAPGTWRQLAIADLKSDLLIGDIGVWLSADCSQAGFGISITPAAQGNRYGVECVRGLIGLLFSATPVAEVVANADVRNFACLAVLAQSGMRHIDTRQAEYKGEICTEHVFSVRKAEG